MTEDVVTLIRINVDDASLQEPVRNIGDLKENISKLKEALNDTNITWEQQQAILKTLEVNQAALKNAMHGTTASYEDVVKAATAANVTFDAQNQLVKDETVSYNALVRQMAILDQEYRSTTDAIERQKLGEKIKSVNDRLKEMDAERGKFGRNVGNYQSALTGLSDILKDMPPTLGKTATEVKKVGQSMALVGKQPILGIVGLLAPIIMKITEGLKDNETALGAVKKMGDALQPVAEFFSGVLETIAGWLSKGVDFVIDLGEKSGISFKTIVTGAVGVGNTLLQFILTPIRTIIDAAKGLGNVFKDIFTGNFKDVAADAKAAITEIGDAWKTGFDFKGNFEAGKNAGEQFAQGLKSPEAKQAASAAGKELAEAALKSADEILKGIDNKIDISLKARVDAEKQAAKDEEDLAAIMEDQWAGVTESIQAELNAQLQAEWDAAQEEKRIARARMDVMLSYGSGVSTVLKNLASVYEADSEANEEAAQKAKALNTASAIISTLTGAVSAYMNTIETVPIPAVAIPLAVINAASVLAAGYAQVKQIQNTKVGSSTGSTGTPAPSVSAPAMVSAPVGISDIQQVRTVTGASEEERLNRMASPQRVYILSSDLEADRNATRTRIAETTF